MNISEVARLTGVSIRTLHHYDKMGLLSPARNPENGYRIYSESDLDRLQQILFFKTCGFPLAKIQELLTSPSFDQEQAFALQEKYLLHELTRIKAMLDTLQKTRQSMRGERSMTTREKFAGFDLTHNPYEEEARQLWGDDAVNQSKTHLESLTTDEQAAISQGMDDLFHELSQFRTVEPSSELAQAAMAKMYRYFNQNFGYQYSLEAFAGVGQLYITDPRFTATIDRYGEGLSAFLAEAMAIFADRQA